MSNEQNLPRNTGEEEQFSNVEDQEDEEDDSVAAATIAATLNNDNIGYCHICDKQVIIDTDSFTCSECHGGFIELFENDSQRQQANTQNESQRARADPMRLLNETVIIYLKLTFLYLSNLFLKLEYFKFIAIAFTSIIKSKFSHDII